MTDAELNLAIHTEVELWEPYNTMPDGTVLYVNPDKNLGYQPMGIDYCHDRAWCNAKQEKHKLEPMWHIGWTWRVYLWNHPGECVGNDSSLCRAIALAVLELHRRK